MVAFALPRLIERKKAIVASREGDRFAAGMSLIEKSVEGSELHSVPLSSSNVRLLPAASVKALPSSKAQGGAPMSKSSVRSKHVSPSEQAARNKASRELARLRSKRAGRIARENAAGRRRLVTTAVGAVWLMLFAVLAAFTAMSWAWLAIPGVFLALTLGSSVYAGQQSMRQGELEDAEMDKLKAILRGEVLPEVAVDEVVDTVRRERGAQGERAAAVDVADSAQSKAASAGSAARVAEAASAVAETEVSAEAVTAAAPVAATAAAAESSESKSAADGSAATRKVATQNEAAKATEGTSKAAASAKVTTIAAPKIGVSPQVAAARKERSWSVGSIPRPSYATKDRVKGRTVHIDTDINPLLKNGEVASAPGRPVAVSEIEKPQSSEVAAQRRRREPSMKFDLDAVLDQRRAQ